MTELPEVAPRDERNLKLLANVRPADWVDPSPAGRYNLVVVGGFVKVHVRQGGDEIVGATVVARHAGEMISEITTAMAGNVGLGRLAAVIHPCPTQAEAIRRAGTLYNRTRLTPGRTTALRRSFAWRRR